MQDEPRKRLPRLSRNKKQKQTIPTVSGLLFWVSFNGQFYLEHDMASWADLSSGWCSFMSIAGEFILSIFVKPYNVLQL